ncbi:hypothetical protein XELAEV_18000349mg [Xenopus laevis]|uniref:Uncharacterized protein n=1 Tax=Xenopus laevis TaxID=8355 RepID=A0A974BP04_XENLA|nr:hypothetical protein XELAEV_18000349mg [Xenopus laevis]
MILRDFLSLQLGASDSELRLFLTEGRWDEGGGKAEILSPASEHLHWIYWSLTSQRARPIRSADSKQDQGEILLFI